jgi:DNA-binding NtrC family response regulator
VRRVARILLVEDDMDVRLLLEHALTIGGFEVLSVETLKSARRLLEAQSFDLVVTDGILLDGTGVDVADEATARDVGVLIVTGHPLSLPLSRYPCLLKPIRPTELIDTIRGMLPKKEGEGDVVPFIKPA